MRRFVRWMSELSDKRSQHLVFLGHVWLFAPFLLMWLRDKHVRLLLGPVAVAQLQPIIGLVIAYLVLRTWLAWRDPPGLKWDYLFPPVDVLIVTVILCVSHRGAMSNISLLYFLPIIEAAGSLSVGWSAGVGLMVVLGTALAAYFGIGAIPNEQYLTMLQMWQDNALNILFRVYFIVVVSSLMTYQAIIGAGLKQRLAVAADRNRIAADMHDGVQGHLITISSQLELLSKLAERDPARAAEIAIDAREMARQGADELRFLVQRMRAPALTNGFVPALRQYAHNICSRNGLELHFEMVGKNPDLEPEQEAALFRVAQESINNVVKHSGAGHVAITLNSEEKTKMTIRDDGTGFEAKPEGCGGLDGMCERLRELGGSLKIDSAPGKGTTVEAEI